MNCHVRLEPRLSVKKRTARIRSEGGRLSETDLEAWSVPRTRYCPMLRNTDDALQIRCIQIEWPRYLPGGTKEFNLISPNIPSSGLSEYGLHGWIISIPLSCPIAQSDIRTISHDARFPEQALHFGSI